MKKEKKDLDWKLLCIKEGVISEKFYSLYDQYYIASGNDKSFNNLLKEILRFGFYGKGKFDTSFTIRLNLYPPTTKPSLHDVADKYIMKYTKEGFILHPLEDYVENPDNCKTILFTEFNDFIDKKINELKLNINN